MTDAELVEAVARRVVELLRESGLDAPARSRLIEAPEAAERLGVSAEWVRDHALELGAVRLGDGPRPRLRFDPERVAEALNRRSGGGGSDEQRSGSTTGPVSARPRRSEPGSIGQLPVRSVNVSDLHKRTGGHRANGPAPATRIEPSTRSQRTPRKRDATAADPGSSFDADDGRRTDGS